MRNTFTTECRRRFAGVSLSAMFALLISLGAASGSLRAAIVDNFNDGDDVGWTHYNPLGAYGVSATYSFPSGGYRISLPAFNHPQLKYSRAGSLHLGTSYTEFHQSVDVTDWTGGAGFGLLARVGNVGLGQTTGYTFHYDSNIATLFVAFMVGESPWYYTGTEVGLTLYPQKQYRMTFGGIGNDLTGQIFDLADPGVALAPISITDQVTTIVPDNVAHTPYTSGLSGLVLASGWGAPAVTFDNFSVSSVPEPTSTLFAGLGLAGLAAWRFGRARRQHP